MMKVIEIYKGQAMFTFERSQQRKSCVSYNVFTPSYGIIKPYQSSRSNCNYNVFGMQKPKHRKNVG